MPKKDQLDDLFALLKTMTLTTRNDAQDVPRGRLQRLENGLLLLTLGAIAAFVLMAAWYRYGPHDPNPHVLLHIYLSVLGLGIAYVVTASIGVFLLFKRKPEERFFTIMTNLRNDLHGDASYLARLLSFDKPTLEYALLQFRHTWNVFDDRFRRFTGDFHKLGLVPALAALSVAASRLLHESAAFFLCAPLIFAGCFYAITFWARGQRERPDQVIALLEYACPACGQRP